MKALFKKTAGSGILVFLVILLFITGGQDIFAQGVGISEAAITPDASAILELRSVSRGFLAPRLTTAQRLGIASPANGLLVFDTDTKSYWYFDGISSTWKAFASGTLGAPNQLLGMNAAGTANEYKTLNGSANIAVTHAPNSITLNTIQDIQTTSSPAFAGLTLTNPLTVANGGTGLNTGISGGIPYFNSAATMSSSALLNANAVVVGGGTGSAPYTIGNGTTGQVLQSSGAAAPSWSTPTYPSGSASVGKIIRSDGTNNIYSTSTFADTYAASSILYSNGANNVAGLATTNNGVLVTDNTGVPSISLTLPTAVQNNITRLGTITNGVWNGTIVDLAHGGTNTDLTGGATGDLLTGTATGFARLSDVAVGNVLISGGAGVAPSYGKVGLTTHVSGILPIGNGGTNSDIALSGSSIMISNGSSIVQGQAGTSTTVLHGNASGAPTFGQVVTSDIADGAVNHAKILDGTIVNNDISNTAAISSIKISSGIVDNNEFDYLDGLTTSVQIQFSNLQTELNTTQTGGGLNADGTYTANGTANYISGATSLKNADDLLDAAIDASAGDITALQTEVNNVETGSGLNADGTYTAIGTANYISGATGLKDADDLLDTQLKTTTDDLSTEVTRATTAEGTLTTNLSTEVTNRGNADAALQTELNTTQTGGGLNADGTYTANGTANYISGATSLKNADDLLDAAIDASAGDITALQTEVNNVETGSGLNADGTYTAIGTANYISGATGLKDADDLLDTQLKTTTDDLSTEVTRATTAEGTLTTNLSTEVTNRGNADAALQTELNTTQTGGGLNADGTYTANGTANYISGATSLKNADDLLDAAIDASAGDITALQTEVNNVETGSGLNADGTYTAIGTANYISGATGLKDADDLLDTQLKTTTDDLSTEVTRATTAEGTLTTNLSTEVTNRGNADAALQTELNTTQTGGGLNADGTYTANGTANYISGATSLKNADDLLDAAIDASAGDITALQTEVNNVETGSGLNADGTYTAIGTANYISGATGLKDADDLLDTQLKTTTDDLSTEVTRATTAEGTLTTNLSTEVTNRGNADAALQTELNTTQTGGGLNADGTYTANGTANYISGATSLKNADDLLDAAIDASAGDITALQTEVNNVETGSGLNADGTYTAIGTANYISGATGLKDADDLLDTQLKTTTDDLSTEVTRATTAEGTLTTNLSTEVTNRGNADAALQTELNTTQTGGGLNADGTYTANGTANYISGATSLKNADDLLDAAIDASAGDITALQTEVNNVETGSGLNADGTYTAIGTANYISGATGLKDADDLLDTQLKTTTDDLSTEVTRATTAEGTLTTNLSTEVTNRGNADAALQTELNTTQTGGGLNADGTYTANGTANYISGATSLKNADDLLDAAIDASAGDITALQTEVNNVETGSGLNADGTYTAIGTANYISGATGLKDADDLLDTQLKTTTDDLSTEVTRATTAEGTLTTNLSTEVTNRGNADAALQTELNTTQTGGGLNADGTYTANGTANYISGATSLKNADDLLDAAIDASAGDITALQTEVNNVETGSGLNADGTYTAIGTANYISGATGLKDADDLLDTQLKTTTDDLSTEVTRATTAEGTLTTNLSTEVTNRGNADAALQTELNTTQTGGGLNADGTYTANGTANYISGATSLKNADDLLDAAIDASAGDITALQTEVNNVETGSGLNADGTYTAIGTANYISGATGLKDADDLLDTQLKTTTDDLSTEVTRATTAEGTLTTNLSTEVTNRGNADAALQTELNTTQTGGGLNADGTYTANGTANYISGATSLKNADDLLDAAIDASAGDITALQTEVNNVETGSGLNADGTYTAIGTANYISGATGLKDADDLLDTQLKTTTDDLSTEVTRATTAEGTLTTNLSTEVTNRGNADAALQTELNTTQTGGGLNADGTYTANGTANYISGATSLKNADDLLDAAIDASAGDITALQTEVNNVETGSGLNADGTYTAIGTANYISGATGLKDADDLLDTQLKTTTDDLSTEVTRATTAEGTLTTNLSTEVTNRGNADAALQTELNTTQTGGGLNADGTYTANGTANYISGATSLKNADDLLDAAIDASAGDITALQTEVNNVETGSGLNADGTYTAIGTANYISGATGLKDADDLLDTQLKTTTDDLSTEVTRATTAEGTLTTNLSTEVTNRGNADAALQTELNTTQTGGGLNADGTYTANGTANYISGATSLKNADDLLDAAIDASAGDITALQTEVNNVETGSGLNADGTYTAIGTANYISGATGLKDADDLLDTQLKTTTDDLSTEVTRATTAEGTLTTNLSTEVTNRGNADAALQTELNTTQTGGGLNADGTYTANGTANYISGATSLKNADDLLDAAIDASAGDITALQTEVNNVETGSGLNADGTYTAIGTANYISGATGLKDADDLLDTQLKTTTDDLSTEVTRATTAEGTLTTNLSTEVTNRGNADAALQTELNTTQTGGGLNADGTYTANGTANYISGATSLKNADDLLDAAIDASAGDITALQTEVNNVETGSGLNADGTYTAIGTANYISGATGLKDADDLLDTQLKTTTDDLSTEVTRATTAEGTLTTNLSTEVTNRGNADAALQTELNTTQTGGGLNADGTYTANGTANYISGATSLKNADDLLDAAIDASAGDITALQTEVNNVETGSGLNADGTYTAIGTANYISGATGLKDADDLLDTQLKTTTDDLSTEVTRATTAEGTLTTNLSTEVTNRGNADAALQTELNTTQTGGGLNADGTYTANGTANYISGATSLKNADDLLDAAIAIKIPSNPAIAGGTNTKITYDSKGLVTSATSATLASADFVGQGTANNVLHGGGAGNPSWSQIVNADIDPTAAIVDTKLATISTAGKVANSATTAINSNTPSTIVLRDGSGNFSAGNITADLIGDVTGTIGATTPSSAAFTTLSANSTTILSGTTSLSGETTISGEIQGATPLIFEGSGVNGFETTIAVENPTSDNQITLPNVSGILAVTLTGTVNINLGSIANMATAQFNITVTGAADGDVVSISVPSTAMSAGLFYNAWVSAANTVTVKVINAGAAFDPPAVTFRASVIKY